MRPTSTPPGGASSVTLKSVGVRVLEDPERIVGLAEKPANSPGVRNGPSAIIVGSATNDGTVRSPPTEVIDDRAGVREVGGRGVGGDDVDERLAAGE